MRFSIQTCFIMMCNTSLFCSGLQQKRNRKAKWKLWFYSRQKFIYEVIFLLTQICFIEQILIKRKILGDKLKKERAKIRKMHTETNKNKTTYRVMCWKYIYGLFKQKCTLRKIIAIIITTTETIIKPIDSHLKTLW